MAETCCFDIDIDFQEYTSFISYELCYWLPSHISNLYTQLGWHSLRLKDIFVGITQLSKIDFLQVSAISARKQNENWMFQISFVIPIDEVPMWTKVEIKESRNDISLKAAFVDRNMQQIFGTQFDSVKFINNFSNKILAAFVNT